MGMGIPRGLVRTVSGHICHTERGVFLRHSSWVRRLLMTIKYYLATLIQRLVQGLVSPVQHACF